MKIQRSGDLMYMTYFMLKWDQVAQTPSDRKCLGCGGLMNRVEDVTDDKGVRYYGLVCHACKTVIWSRH